MKNLFHFVITIAVAALTAGTIAYMNGGSDGQERLAKVTRLDQIKRTGVLRCGYVNEPPFEAKDPNTGQMSGLGYELVEEIGKQLNIKIEWASEVSYGQMLADLAVNKYDMICAPFYALPSRAREANLSMPLFYFPAYLYARKDDARFDNRYDAANSPTVKFAVLDGNFSSTAAYRNFPKAEKVTTPEMTTVPDLFVQVATRKADLVVSDPGSFANYNKNNPGTLRQVAGNPLQVMAGVFLLPAKEQDLKNATDATLAYLHGIGYIEALLKKYETPDIQFLYLNKPYTSKTMSVR
ncbi:MAG: transporter substrate-binding domain-containing protein [Alphaproteobacteria bacterium]|nr:transporter substrate-binding domain-containing protein [Alphaproteobacteria bacterium]